MRRYGLWAAVLHAATRSSLLEEEGTLWTYQQCSDMPDGDDRRTAALSVHFPVVKINRSAPALEVCTTFSPSSALSRTYFTRPIR